MVKQSCALLRLAVAAALIGGPVAAQPPPAATNGNAGTDANSVTISRGKSVSDAVSDWSRAANAVVVVDPALANGRVSAATSQLTLEPGLTALARQFRAQWRKVYLAESQIPRAADGRVDARSLKIIVEAASTAPPVTVGVVDPNTGQMTVTSRAAATDPAMQAWAKAYKPVYLLYMPGPEIHPETSRPGSLEALRNMTPEQRRQWMEQNNGIIVTSDMSPEERAAVLQRLPPEERERFERRLREGGDQVMVLREERHEEQHEQQ